MTDIARVELVPFALKDAPALIETVFPVQKVSFEAQKERKANLGQTLTGLGSYWKGRKPLILVRAIVLGSLLPATDNAEADLAVFEKLMAFDDESMARRLLIANTVKPAEIAARIVLHNPWDFFKPTIRNDEITEEELRAMSFPVDVNDLGISLRWQRDMDDNDKLQVYRKLVASYHTYDEPAGLAKRPEELDQHWLYQPVWAQVNNHYAHLGINAHSMPELVEQLGMLRFGHRPRVGDTFSGGGSIPFEAARVGCDVYASDLNPVACMLTWGAFNIIGAGTERREEILEAQEKVAKAVDAEITALGIEHDSQGNRAKAYLYCLETRCPETGWMIPLSPSWVISKNRNVIAELIPDYANKRFTIEVNTGVSTAKMKMADQGTIQSGDMVYTLEGKTYRTPIKTIRGDYRTADGATANRLRKWDKLDFMPRPDDIFQERLYAIHWITRDTIGEKRQITFFSAPSAEDDIREKKVQELVASSLAAWQEAGLVPDMIIEEGDKTDEPIRTRGWTHWHHLFNARHLLLNSILRKNFPADVEAPLAVLLGRILNVQSKMSRWSPAIGHDLALDVFYNMALNTFYNYGCRASISAFRDLEEARFAGPFPLHTETKIVTGAAADLDVENDIYITDPPYADAVMYHEITEYFIAWLRKNPPKPFDEWVWDSRRALAVKGSGDDFRRAMVAAYKAMAEHMPDNGMQCVMFTHQDTSVWSDMVSIFWAAGLQVVAAWYIATETSTELKKGGYVQGTVTLMLRKRRAGEREGFKQRLLPAVKREVERQIHSMMHLNATVEDDMGEPVFNDSDLQMAGYAAALKILTAYTHIGGEDVTTLAMRPRTRGEVTVIDEIVQQAAEAANELLVPEGLKNETWAKLSGIERFMFRMLDIETTGAGKLDNYQNFAKAFHVEDYAKVMGSMTANKARLKAVEEFASRDLSDSTELGASRLGSLIVALQQLLQEVEPQAVVKQLQLAIPDALEARELLVDMLAFMETKAAQPKVRTAAEVLGARLKNQRFGA